MEYIRRFKPLRQGMFTQITTHDMKYTRRFKPLRQGIYTRRLKPMTGNVHVDFNL